MSAPLLHLLAPFASYQSDTRLQSTMIMADAAAARRLLVEFTGLCPSLLWTYCYQSDREVFVISRADIIRRVLLQHQPTLVSKLWLDDGKTWTQAQVTYETRSA